MPLQYDVETARLPAGRDCPVDSDFRDARPVMADNLDHAFDILKAGAQAAREMGLVGSAEHGWARIRPTGCGGTPTYRCILRRQC